MGVGSCQNNGGTDVSGVVRFRCIVKVELFFFGICVNKWFFANVIKINTSDCYGSKKFGFIF